MDARHVCQANSPRSELDVWLVPQGSTLSEEHPNVLRVDVDRKLSEERYVWPVHREDFHQDQANAKSVQQTRTRPRKERANVFLVVLELKRTRMELHVNHVQRICSLLGMAHVLNAPLEPSLRAQELQLAKRVDVVLNSAVYQEIVNLA
jgi:hypothetical protein